MIENLYRMGIILDFDGTLIDSLPLWRSVDRDFLAERGFSVPEDLHQHIEGKGFLDCAIYFKKRFNLPESLEKIMADWQDMVWEKYRRCPLKEDARRFLCHRDWQPVIATSGARFLVEEVLQNNGVRRKIRGIVTSDEVGKSKPEPHVFWEAARLLKRDPADCLVFEDTLAGVMGGKNAGMKVVAVYEAENKRWDETRSLADYAIDSFDELMEGR